MAGEISTKRQLGPTLLCSVALAAAFSLGPAAQAAMPPGYEVVQHEELGPGVELLSARLAGPNQEVRVARIASDAPFALRAVPATGSGRKLERTSSICLRVSCLLAVNGDFWQPRTGAPVGGLLSGGQILRAPSQNHRQLLLPLDGPPTTGDLQLRGTLVSTDLRSVAIASIDHPLQADGVGLFTPAYGASAPASEPRVDLELEVVRPNGPLHLSSTAVIIITGLGQTTDPAAIPAGGALLSGVGKGAAALQALWDRIQDRKASPEALLRLESTPEALDSLGGNPLLVQDGQSVVPTDDTSFVRGRHPRTMVGRTADNEALLVTVDGRQPGHSEGMSLAEAAQLMIDLGAVDALNLDGGGSTTFVTRGEVVNRPSDRAVGSGDDAAIVNVPESGQAVRGNVERPVAVALALVPRTEDQADAAGDLFAQLSLPPVLELSVPHSSDPASDPAGSLPALVVPADAGSKVLPAVLAMASALVLMLGTVTLWEHKLRRPALRRLPFLRSQGLRVDLPQRLRPPSDL